MWCTLTRLNLRTLHFVIFGETCRAIETDCLVEKYTLKTLSYLAGSVTQWVAGLTRNQSVVSSNPIKGSDVSGQENLPSLLSTGWFQEGIWVSFHNQTKTNWGPYENSLKTTNADDFPVY